MRGQWRIILGIILVFIIAFFSVANISSVPINFGFVQVEWPMILVIIGSALIGALIVVLANSTQILKKNREIKKIKPNNSRVGRKI